MIFDLLDILYTDKLKCTIEELDLLGEYATDKELEIVNNFVFNDKQEKEAFDILNHYRCK